MKKYISLLLVLCLLAGCTQPTPESNSPESAAPEASQPQAAPEYDNQWETDTPENHAMDSRLLADLHNAVTDEIFAIVTVRDGYIVDEYYREDYNEDSVFTFHSCSKSFTGALVGLAINQGHIDGVDTPLAELLPQVSDYDDDQKQQITLRHLLTNTSGLEWYEWGGNSSTWQPFRSSDNWVDFILERPMLSQPGSSFAYSTGNTHLLSAALQNAVGMSTADYGQEYIFEPLGMDSVTWGADDQGVTDGGNGIAMTARDAAKFGSLYLDGGRWRGRQILPESWVEISTQRMVTGADGITDYGYQWWVRTCGDGYEVYYAMGAFGQFIFVVPELNLVTVITSRSGNTYQPRTYFIDYILAACGDN